MSATLYKCDQCDLTFNIVNDLEEHRRNEHIKPAPPAWMAIYTNVKSVMSITDTTIRLWKNKKVGEGVMVDIYILRLIRRCMQLLCLDMNRYELGRLFRKQEVYHP